MGEEPEDLSRHEVLVPESQRAGRGQDMEGQRRGVS